MLYKKFLLFLVLFLAILLVAFELITYQEREGGNLEVYFLDIGQGDATLISYQSDQQILIDGGPNGKKLMGELGKNMPKMDRKIELVILTHPDKDHLAGLIDVMNHYEVELLLDNGQAAETEVYKELQRKIEEKEIRKEMIPEGSKIRVGKQLEFSAFNPDGFAGIGGDRNDNSVVLRMDYGKNSFLFTGDAEFSAEQDMISDGENLDVDWLKVGHHGSDSSTSKKFLDIVTPEFAVISAGKENRYGHPEEAVLNNLEEAEAKIFRTDKLGTIIVNCENTIKKCTVK